ncbi:hypothetical protein [Noviherbaspirillum autotrophicum]|uniref:hypothetical protein n=1 Tax=Noviherbaspirillum autotrophicum TaxID=709839 RepID=UPI000B2B5E89|nr:hypothetical protein [Noviherbaspirillum autotrophicum]
MTAPVPWRTASLDHRPSGPTVATSLGVATLGLAAVAGLIQLKRAIQAKPSPHAGPHPDAVALVEPASFAARELHGSAALLATSVLTDSALEHYRGDFENPGMITPLLASLMTVIAGASSAASTTGRSRMTRDGIYATAVAVGAAGFAFHLYNVLRRPGGLGWLNLFYSAPIGAPAALSLAGLIGLAAQRVRDTPAGSSPSLLGVPAGQILSALTGIGLAGTSSEVGLLHFRGAFHNPFMWLPVTVPPIASVLMIADTVAPARVRHGWLTRAWLALTGMLGIAGIAFHAYGVARQMGGWRNIRQNVLSGPPLSAPPSFTALALAGFAALSLRTRHENWKGTDS